MDTHKLIIIGSGPSGLTAAIYAARAGLKPVVVAGLTFGGQLMLTTEVENFPGFPEGIMGPDLMQNFIKQAERFGSQIIYEDVVKVDFSSKPFKLSTGDHEYQAESVIITTGASTMWLGLPSEEKFRGKGVSSCATCDGFFFKGKEIIVVGGGDSAMEEANYLTKFASKVTILNRSEKFRASKIMHDRAKANPKIEFECDKTIEEFLGDVKLTGVKVKDVKTGEISERKIDGVFVAIGHKPNTEIFSAKGGSGSAGKGQIELDAKGYIVPYDGTKTNIPGVFVGGDVRDYRYRQAITAAGMGCMAAMDAEKFLEMDHG
jgi:thioredoxin reductase (NADPH)